QGARYEVICHSYMRGLPSRSLDGTTVTGARRSFRRDLFAAIGQAIRGIALRSARLRSHEAHRQASIYLFFGTNEVTCLACQSDSGQPGDFLRTSLTVRMYRCTSASGTPRVARTLAITVPVRPVPPSQ